MLTLSLRLPLISGLVLVLLQDAIPLSCYYHWRWRVDRRRPTTAVSEVADNLIGERLPIVYQGPFPMRIRVRIVRLR